MLALTYTRAPAADSGALSAVSSFVLEVNDDYRWYVATYGIAATTP